MNIIKRSGIEEVFDITKIINAMTKANNEVPEVERLTAQEIRDAANAVAAQCEQMERAASVEEIQDLVEAQIMARG